MKAFPRHLLDLTATTIVSVMWTKKEVIQFMEECNVPPLSLSRLEFIGLENYTKRQMISEIFEELWSRPDKGTPQFELMVNRMCNWTVFNPRHFGPDGNLDLEQARTAITALRQAVGLQELVSPNSNPDSFVSEKSVDHTTKISDLRNTFTELANLNHGSLNPQTRGFKFEEFLNELFLVSGIPSEGSFRVNGLQIDGAFKFDNHHYLLEAKWKHSSESAEPLLFFGQKVGANMDGRGLFISLNGFTDPSILALSSARIRDVILMDGQDLFAILDERITLSHCLDEKIRAAQTRGALYFDPVTRESKIKFAVNQCRSS